MISSLSLDQRAFPIRGDEFLARVMALSRADVDLGLERISRLLAIMGHPERKVPFVHVAGTNGKGSVVATLASLLQAGGYRVGWYTSPHLHLSRERYLLNSSFLPEALLLESLETVDLARRRAAIDLTFFEVFTAVAFEAFARLQPDLVILEVGLGGRLDATNVIDPLVGAITSLGHDHQDRLGAGLEAIAAEKGGIIKAGRPLVVGPLPLEARAVVERIGLAKGAPLLWEGRDFALEEGGEGGLVYRGSGRSVEGLTLALAGEHQVHNAAVALALLEALEGQGFGVADEVIRRGLASVRWPGRFEVLGGRPLFILDCAHNPEAAQALAKALVAQRLARGPWVLVLGVLADKDFAAILGALASLFSRVIITLPPDPLRAPDDQVLALRASMAGRGSLVVPLVAEAMAVAATLAGEEGGVVVTGSCRTVAAARQARGLLSPWDDEPAEGLGVSDLTVPGVY